MKCGVRSVECEDFASSLAEKKSSLSREGHGRDRLASNYRSFILGKLPPPACPGLCYMPLLSNDSNAIKACGLPGARNATKKKK